MGFQNEGYNFWKQTPEVIQYICYHKLPWTYGGEFSLVLDIALYWIDFERKINRREIANPEFGQCTIYFQDSYLIPNHTSWVVHTGTDMEKFNKLFFEKYDSHIGPWFSQNLDRRVFIKSLDSYGFTEKAQAMRELLRDC